MSAVATAVVGAAVIGAVASKNASDKAAKGVKDSIKSTNNLASQARLDAMNYYALGSKSARSGVQGALDFYKSAAPTRYAPLQQGNVAAQNVLGQGYTQANNAILGLPMDQSFAQTPTKIQYDTSAIQNAQLPQSQLGLGQPPAQPVVQPQQSSNQSSSTTKKLNDFTKYEVMTGGLTGGLAGTIGAKKGSSGVKKLLTGGLF